MAYSRRTVTDFETVMNADLYNNVQDGIDETKQALGEVDVAEKGTVQVQINNLERKVAGAILEYDEETTYLEMGTESGGDEGGGEVDENDIITPEEAAAIWDAAEQEA